GYFQVPSVRIVRQRGFRGALGIVPVQLTVHDPSFGTALCWNVCSFGRNGPGFASPLWGFAWVCAFLRFLGKTLAISNFVWIGHKPSGLTKCGSRLCL